jgi:hypothetical protein
MHLEDRRNDREVYAIAIALVVAFVAICYLIATPAYEGESPSTPPTTVNHNQE